MFGGNLHSTMILSLCQPWVRLFLLLNMMMVADVIHGPAVSLQTHGSIPMFLVPCVECWNQQPPSGKRPPGTQSECNGFM